MASSGSPSLLLLPGAIALWSISRPHSRLLAGGALVCGLGSALAWAYGFAFAAWSLEPLWIWLSAAWWIGLGVAIVRGRHRVGGLTLLVGLAAALDAADTAFVQAFHLPSRFFGLLGGWKLPLQLLWTVAMGVWMVAASVTKTPNAGRGDDRTANPGSQHG